MLNHIISNHNWHNWGSLSLIIACVIMLLAYLIRDRYLTRCIDQHTKELARLKVMNQQLSEQVELYNSGYQELPEYLTDNNHRDHVSDVATIGKISCWSSLLRISAGDKHIAVDLAKLLVNEIPAIIHHLEQMSTVMEAERELLHQWQGLFRCCGQLALADQFSLNQLCNTSGDYRILPIQKDRLISELRQVLVETFNVLRQREPEQLNTIKEIAS